MVWKYGLNIEPRLLYSFGTEYQDPFGGGCEAAKCDLTYDHDQLGNADAVLVHLYLTKGPHELPPRSDLH